MTEEQIKDYVSKNCCGLYDNRKWCSIQNECFVVNAITEATKELQEELKHKKIAIQTRKARIKDLKKQIDKMKNQWNCKNNNGHCISNICPCKDKWELKEN